jgi:uncharacterized protein YkwD
MDAGSIRLAHWTRSALTALAATLAAALMSVPVVSARPTGGAGDISSTNVVKLSNDVRVKNGVGNLDLDPRLSRAAQMKADDMAARGYLAHETPDGRTPWDWIERAGYDFLAAAENLAVGYPNDAELISAWMESEGHRHNLLNQKYTDVGIGIARGMYKGQDSLFVVQMFGKPRVLRQPDVLAAQPIAPDHSPLPAVPLMAIALQSDSAPPVTVTLEAARLYVDPLTVPTLPLELAEQAPLDSFGIPVEFIQAPAVPLSARAVSAGVRRLPRLLPRSRRLASILRAAH